MTGEVGARTGDGQRRTDEAERRQASCVSRGPVSLMSQSTGQTGEQEAQAFFLITRFHVVGVDRRTHENRDGHL